MRIDRAEFAGSQPSSRTCETCRRAGRKYCFTMRSSWTGARAGMHHFILNDAGIKGMAGDVVEVGFDVGENFLARGKSRAKELPNRGGQAAEDLIEDRAVKGFFVFEVVVEQGFVDLAARAMASMRAPATPSRENSRTAACRMAARLCSGRPREPRRGLGWRA